MKPALLIVDMQKEYYVDKTLQLMDSAVQHINYVIPAFEKKGLPIVWIQDIDEEEGVTPGGENFDIIQSLVPGPEDIRIHKAHGGNSFNRTDLDRILKEKNVDTVIVSGFCAKFCVLSTYRGARDLEYFPVILKNGIASTSEANKEFVEDLSETITAAFLRNVIAAL